MNRYKTTLMALLACSLYGGPAFADKACSTKEVAGNWVFATGIGRQMLPIFPPDKDITAIGTMNISKDGSLSGKFDVTIEDTAFATFEYGGSIVVNPDCTGTVEFVTTAGSMRMDSIAVVSRSEILGMSQDPFNLWTYQIRRLAGDGRGND